MYFDSECCGKINVGKFSLGGCRLLFSEIKMFYFKYRCFTSYICRFPNVHLQFTIYGNSGVASPEKLVVLKFGNEAAEGN